MKLNKYLFNTVNNKEHGRPCLHHLHVLSTVFSWWPFSSFILWIILLPPSLPLYSSSVKSVWQVPGSIGMGAHGWRAWVCQPWGRNSVWGLAVPKVEAPGHLGHPPPPSDTVVNAKYDHKSCYYLYIYIVSLMFEPHLNFIQRHFSWKFQLYLLDNNIMVCILVLPNLTSFRRSNTSGFKEVSFTVCNSASCS